METSNSQSPQPSPNTSSRDPAKLISSERTLKIKEKLITSSDYWQMP